MIRLLIFLFVLDEVMTVLKLDNQVVGQTSWKSYSQQCWDQRMNFNLDRVCSQVNFDL